MVAVAFVFASDARAAAVPTGHDLQPQPIARNDLPAELRVVDAAQIDDCTFGGASTALDQQDERRHLRQRASSMSTAGISGLPGSGHHGRTLR